MDNLFKVLGDENRLRILNILRNDELCVCEIEVILGITQSNVSRHLSKLKSEDIIVFEKKAQWIHYHINPHFNENNKLLYYFISEKMDQDEKFLKDIERLNQYKASGISCENLKEMRNLIFT